MQLATFMILDDGEILNGMGNKISIRFIAHNDFHLKSYHITQRTI